MSYTIAIQKNGKLNEGSKHYLQSQGVQVSEDNVLVSECSVTGIRILYLRGSDIPEYVLRGVADQGIVGENVLREKRSPLNVSKSLGFGACKLIIAVPNDSTVKTVKDLQGERIATSYPETLGTYLRELGIQAAIINVSGSVESAPELNLADAVCDITQTGRTLKAHNLRILDTVLESQAVLVER